jgi:hypothetical protein
VHPVRLIEARIGGDAVEEKRHERHGIFFSEIGIDRIEFLGVFVAEISSRHHSGDEHRLAARLQLLDDLRQSVAGDGGVDAAQHVVGAELDDDDVGLRGNGPFEPRQPVGGGVARHAGIDDGDVVAARLERHLKLLGEGFAWADAEPRRQAVAKRDDPYGVRRSRGKPGERQPCGKHKAAGQARDFEVVHAEPICGSR